MKRITLMLILASLAMVTVGCGGAGAGGTPQETLANIAAAFRAGDSAAMLGCYKTNEEGKRAMEAMVPVAKVMIAFSEKMEAAYGEKAGKVFGGSGPRNMAENLSKAEIKIDGDTATAKVSGERKLMNLVKENGVWLVIDEDLAKMSKEKVDAMLKQVVPMRAALESVMGEIGKDGVTQEDIMQKMEEAMEEAMK